MIFIVLKTGCQLKQSGCRKHVGITTPSYVVTPTRNKKDMDMQRRPPKSVVRLSGSLLSGWEVLAPYTQ